MIPTQVLSYEDSGKGFPIVLIHGFCESKEVWKDFQQEFSKNYRVVSLDLPGFGESLLERSDISIEYMAEKVHDLLAYLDIRQCVMIGHSLGGYVTLAFAEKYENKLKGIGLFHSTAYADSEEKQKSRDKTIEFLEKYGAESFAVSFVPPLFYLPNREKFKDTIQWVTQIAAATSKESMIATTKAMRDRKSRIDVLKKIQIPILFIIGKEDSVMPLEASLEQAAMPTQATTHVLSEAGHMGMFEKKEKALEIIDDFLKEKDLR